MAVDSGFKNVFFGFESAIARFHKYLSSISSLIWYLTLIITKLCTRHESKDLTYIILFYLYNKCLSLKEKFMTKKTVTKRQSHLSLGTKLVIGIHKNEILVVSQQNWDFMPLWCTTFLKYMKFWFVLKWHMDTLIVTTFETFTRQVIGDLFFSYYEFKHSFIALTVINCSC